MPRLFRLVALPSVGRGASALKLQSSYSRYFAGT